MNRKSVVIIVLGALSALNGVCAGPSMDQVSFVAEMPSVEQVAPSNTGSPGKVYPKFQKKIVVTRFGDLQKNEITWSDGTTTQDWITGKYILIQNPYQEGINVFETSDALVVAPFRFVMPGFLSRDLDEKNARVDETRNPPASYFKRGTEELWFDAKTGLPVEFKDGSLEVKFTFLEAPTSPPVMPQAYSKALKDMLRTVRSPGVKSKK